MELNVIKNRYTYYIISTILILISIVFLTFTKLNLGIDMTWWTSSEYAYTWELDNIKITETLKIEAKKLIFNDKEVINDVSAYKITGQNKLAVVIGFDSSIETKKLEELKNSFRAIILSTLKTTNSNIIESNYTNIWKSFWDYIKNTAFLTLWLAIIGIAIYLAWAFSATASGISTISFSIIVILTLFHDVIISTWLYIFSWSIFPEFKIDTFFITALLTILWYSINDTIVVFDRIRANLKVMLKQNKALNEIIDIAIKDTLRRSIFSSLTVFLVLLAIFFFWPESIKWFVLTMLFGVIIGTYSSIFIASPLLYEMNKNKTISEYKEKENKIEDKIVI